VKSGNIGCPSVAEFPVYLIGKEVKVVFLNQCTDLVHFLTGIQVPRGVVGVANHDGLGPGSDQFFKLFHGRQGKAALDAAQQGFDHCTCRHGESRIVGVGGFRHDDLIAGIQTGHESKQHSLGSTCGHDDIIDRDVDIEAVVVFHQFVAQAQDTIAGAVFQHVSVNRPQRRHSHLRGFDIGLTDIQVVYDGAFGFGFVGQGHQFTDGRGWHDLPAFRRLRHGDFGVFLKFLQRYVPHRVYPKKYLYICRKGNRP